MSGPRRLDRRAVLAGASTVSLGALLDELLPGIASAGLDSGFHFVRIQQGADGRSYIEEYDPIQPAEKPPCLYRQAAVQVALLRWPAGTEFGWGPTHGGVRRLLVTVSGLTVTIVDDGATPGQSYHPLKPGSVMLAEDFAGRGHHGKVFADEDSIVFQVDLA